MSNRKEIIFFWIPGHIGIQGNEKADQAAKRALSDRISEMKMPLSDFKPIIFDYVIRCWQEDWNMEVNNKLHVIKLSVRERVPLHSYCRREDVVITRLRLGHTHLTHSHLLSGDSPPLCNYCDTKLSISHVLLVCPLFAHSRRKLSSAHTLAQFFRKNSDLDIINFTYD